MQEALSPAVGMALLSTLAAALPADAAQEVAQLADNDGRLGLLVLAPAVALGWVGFNILGPLQNQLKAQQEKQERLR